MSLRFTVILCSILMSNLCPGQTILIERLKTTIAAEKDPGKKLDAVLDLCEQRQSLHSDTLARYAHLAKELALQNKDDQKLILADYFIASYLAKKEQFDSVLKIDERNLRHLSYENNKDAYVKFSIQKGQTFLKSERYKEALEEFYKILDEAEKQGDALTQANAKTNIGWVNMEMGQNEEALKWFYGALESGRDIDMPDYLGVIYSNMAATYNELNRNDSAEFFINKAISVNRKSGKNLSFLANALAIQADIFIDTGRKALAEPPLNEALKIRQLIGEPFYIVSDMTQLAIFYASNNEADKGISLCKHGIELANQFGLSAKLPILYQALAENYRVAGMYKEYAETLATIISLKDSVYQKNSAEALAGIQGKYDLQKKENTIIQQQLDLTRKNYLFFGSLILVLFILVAGYSIFRNYRKKQQVKMARMLDEEKRLAAQAVIKAEEKERKRISADLHDNLGVYAASIAANIDQILVTETSAENKTTLEELRNNSQSIVSQLSDTIWALKKDALSLTAISDRLKLFIQRIQASYPGIRIDVVEKITDDHLLAPSQAFHLFQIMKEAINNSLKHSGCREIVVTIEAYVDKQWKISIADDGRGLGRDQNIHCEGNGLQNMKNRSLESSWKIEWQVNRPNGTCVIIEPATS